MTILSPSKTISQVSNLEEIPFRAPGVKAGRTVNLNAELGLTGTNTHFGFSCLCIGRNDEQILLLRDASTHSSNDGVTKICRRRKGEATFSAPITFLNNLGAGKDAHDLTIGYDLASDRYIITVQEITVADTTLQQLRIFWTAGDPIANASAWTEASVTTAFNRRNCSISPAVRRNRTTLWLAYYGTTDTDAETRPGILQSSDNGATWTPLVHFPEVPANEGTLFCRYSSMLETDENFLLCRNNTLSSPAYLIRSTKADFSEYEAVQIPLWIAGAPRVLMMGDYFALFARLSRDSNSGSMGYMAFSIDGFNWSEPEYNGIVYPCHQSPAKTSSGRVLMSSVSEPSNTNSSGKAMLTEVSMPSYLEVLEKVRMVDTTIAWRWTVIEAGATYQRRIEFRDRKEIALTFNVNNNPASNITVTIDYFFKPSTWRPVTLPLTVVGNMAYGTFTPLRRWARISITNGNGATREINGFLSS